MDDDEEATRRVHLHMEDHPATLQLLSELRNGRRAEDWALIGYEATEHGAWVDWDKLLDSWLSSTEKALVHIARGCAVLEHSGGPSPRMIEPLRRTINAVTQPSTYNK